MKKRNMRVLSRNWGSWYNKLVFLHFWKCFVFLRYYGFTCTSPMFLVFYNEALDMYVIIWHMLVLSLVSENPIFTEVYFQTLYIVSKYTFWCHILFQKFIFRQKKILVFFKCVHPKWYQNRKKFSFHICRTIILSIRSLNKS